MTASYHSLDLLTFLERDSRARDRELVPISRTPDRAGARCDQEPVLEPLRRVVPRVGLFDITPMVAILLIIVIQSLLASSVR